ncbi:MAG: hypothetical protein GF388_05290 [Candidatus Aegiribacteria sp.]|nr:hypothetical protein [Candidatus Aegiribacteria sp.]MBD3294624.1 hypothetical protein [Candidatus Fermentibacteria bacterium]
MNAATLWIIITAVVLVGVAIVYLIMRPKGKAAEQTVQPGQPFELSAQPQDGKPYKFWVTYSITWTGVKNGFGLIYDLEVEVDGSRIMQKQLRMGRSAVTDEDREKIMAMVRSERKLPDGVISPNKVHFSGGRHGRIHFEKATIPVYTIESRRQGSRISVRGRISSSENTSIESLRIFLAR